MTKLNTNPIAKISRCTNENKRLFARKLKSKLTPSEIKFARSFQSWKSKGLIPKCSMRGQKVVDPYIVDFAINDFKLCVEIDGSFHNGRSKYDYERDSFIYSKIGYTTMRVKSSDVFNDPEGIIFRLKFYFNYYIENGYQQPPQKRHYRY